MTYRNPDLLRLAKQAPHCMGCGDRNTGRVVSAHSNQYRDGHGKSLKSSDAAIAFLGLRCHSRLDQGMDMTKEQRAEFFDAAHRATMRWLIEEGLLVVRPADYVEPVHAPKPKAKVGKSRPMGKGPGLPGGGKIPTRPFGR